MSPFCLSKRHYFFHAGIKGFENLQFFFFHSINSFAAFQALIGAENASLRSMGTSELMEMFTLEGDDKTAVREPSRKKAKK